MKFPSFAEKDLKIQIEAVLGRQPLHASKRRQRVGVVEKFMLHRCRGSLGYSQSILTRVPYGPILDCTHSVHRFYPGRQQRPLVWSKRPSRHVPMHDSLGRATCYVAYILGIGPYFLCH